MNIRAVKCWKCRNLMERKLTPNNGYLWVCTNKECSACRCEETVTSGEILNNDMEIEQWIRKGY